MDNSTKTSASSTSSTTSTVLLSAMSGAAIATAAMHFATRGRIHDSQSNLLRMVQTTLEHNLKQTTAKFETSLKSQELAIAQSLRPIEATKQQLTDVNRNVSAIKDIFHAPKSRGSFGEFQLETLIRDCMSSTNMYDFQYTLSNRKRVDCILHMPAPIGKLAIDSKFPLDSLQDDLFSNGGNNEALTTSTTDSSSKKKKIQQTLQKHINDIATKYIIPGETAGYAIMFLPSEAVFLTIVDEYRDVVMSAMNQQKVYVTCSTSLMVLLAQLHCTTRDIELHQQTDEMLQIVHKIMENADRFMQRFDQATKSLEKAKEVFNTMQISIAKMRRGKTEFDVLGGGRFAATTTNTKKKTTTRPTTQKSPEPVNATETSKSEDGSGGNSAGDPQT